MTQGTTKRLPTIGTVIRAWRIYHGFSSTELAEKARVRLGYLSEIEHDRTLRPYEDYLEKLADALHVPLEDIFGRRMPPKKVEGKKLKRATGPTLSPKQPTASMPKIVHSAKTIPYVDPLGEEIKEFLASAGLSEEEEEQVRAEVKEHMKRLVAIIKTLRKERRTRR